MIGCRNVGSHTLSRYRSTVCRRRYAMARPSCAVETNDKTSRDVALRLRRGYGATSWAESGFALPSLRLAAGRLIG